MSQIQDTTHAQESRASVHKRNIHVLVTTGLPFKTGDSRACVNHAREVELVQLQELHHYFLLLYCC